MNFRTMTTADIAFGMRLKAQNHWNQLEDDWQRQLDLEPDGCFVAEVRGVPVGTACCCVFDSVAWINMVLVDRDQRGQGVGTSMMRHVLQYLDERGIVSIRLDATVLGQPVYAKLGFTGDFTLERYEGILPSAPATGVMGEEGTAIEPLTEADLSALFEFDQFITSTRRAELLRHLFTQHPKHAFKHTTHGQLDGYCLARPGSNAWQIGPIQASPPAGRALLLQAAVHFAGQPVYLDAPTANAEANAVVQALGLTVQRSFLRMTRGRKVAERLDHFWSSFGPEKG
jgi:GNAT superfamily N-acetyltransferase